MRRAGVAAGLGLGLGALTGGCVDRTLSITSEPAGALVILNDVEVGRTPLDVDFKFYGDYDVRLMLEGHEPVLTHREVKAPISEIPPFDLIAAAAPADIHNRFAWHFVLTPLAETGDRAAAERALIDRARELRRASAEGIGAPGGDGAPAAHASGAPK